MKQTTKEFFKTAILTCLVISSLVLSANIWYEKELWSMDYSSFMYSLKNFFQRNASDSFSSTDDLIRWSEFSPEFLSFTYGSKKMIYYNSSPGFEEADRTAADILFSLSKEGTIVSITEEEYLNTYKTNSLMLKFPMNINLKQYLRQEDSFFDTVKEPYASTLVIGIDDSQSNYLSFTDSKSGRAYRIPVTTNADSKAIEALIQASDSNASFAFELNFDVKKDDTNRILFHRFVPITLEAAQLTTLKAEPLVDFSAYDPIFKAFRIVKNSARTYRDKENTIHFIENRSTLKLYENGMFHFEANQPESGISLNNQEETKAVLEFVNLLYRKLVPESDAFLSLWHKEQKGEKTLYELIYTTRNGSLFWEEAPAVSLLVEDGTILKYDQLLLSVAISRNTQTTTGVIEAYDFLYNQPDFSEKSKLTIQSMIPAHIYRNGQAKPGWVCEFSNHSVSYFIPET